MPDTHVEKVKVGMQLPPQGLQGQLHLDTNEAELHTPFQTPDPTHADAACW